MTSARRPARCRAASAHSSALTLAIAKRPELLLDDEPVASLDLLARRDFLRSLMDIVAEHSVSVVLSSQWSPTVSGCAITWSCSASPACSSPATWRSLSRPTTG